MSRKKWVLMIVIDLAIIIALIAYFIKPHADLPKQIAQIDGVLLTPPKLVSQFEMMTMEGKTFTQENLKGHWTLLLFGFTNCGYVCPTTLSSLNKMVTILKTQLPSDQLPQVVMVSVDPERDTAAKMKSYLSAFNSQFIGVNGDLSHTKQLEKQFHVVSVKMQVKGQTKDHYSINHSAEILVFNPKGFLIAYLSYPHEAAQMAKDYKWIIKHV